MLYLKHIMLGALSTFEACCQWEILIVIVCKSLHSTLLFKFTLQRYIYPSVSKDYNYAASFHVFVFHQTLTVTTDMDYMIILYLCS